MNKKKYLTLAALAATTLLTSCATMDNAPQKTSLQIQAIQAKEFETTKDVAFASTLSVFQDLGYIVGSASLETGFITAKSPTKGGMQLFVGSVMEDTKATAFVEQTDKKHTKVRLNFVNNRHTSSGYGMKSEHETPVEDPQIYQNAFTKIQEAVFIRSASK